MLEHVHISPLPIERFESLLAPGRFAAFNQLAGRAREFFDGRAVWNVNSTARGGGVVEMLRPLLAYARGAGVDARWVVIGGNSDFFRITKRIHNNLHGFEGDGGPLGELEREGYELPLDEQAAELAELVRPEDVVILHDPQTAGMARAVKETGATVIWRCHVGLDLPNPIARRAWGFLIPYVDCADAYVFSRQAFAWEGLDDDKVALIAPAIDAFSPKNQDLDQATRAAILAASGLVTADGDGQPTFTREDGTPGRVDRKAQLFEDAPIPPDAPIVLQVSRWDRLKDPHGVITGFAEHVAPRTEAHLVYAGPAVEAVSDDPEGGEVLAESRGVRERLPDAVRERVHLACLPMDDLEENAAIVNALQRRADVVVQKSVAEGFGLTVAEAKWKARPVVASRIGGIQDQIVHGETGLLVDDPRDLAAYGASVTELLEEEERARRMGAAAQERVRDHFLGVRSLMQYFELIGKLGG
ncbi:MAG: glycosyltransferase [Actinomycetota bacterium]|nr:glycosyltransferase [Actinomycetota bacterium]